MSKIVLLTYYGDDTIVTPFTTFDKAVNYALDVLVKTTDYPVEAFEVRTEGMAPGIMAVISDSPEGGDERVYVITEHELDPSYPT